MFHRYAFTVPSSRSFHGYAYTVLFSCRSHRYAYTVPSSCRFHGYAYDGIWAIALAIQHVDEQAKATNESILGFAYK